MKGTNYREIFLRRPSAGGAVGRRSVEGKARSRPKLGSACSQQTSQWCIENLFFGFPALLQLLLHGCQLCLLFRSENGLNL